MRPRHYATLLLVACALLIARTASRHRQIVVAPKPPTFEPLGYYDLVNRGLSGVLRFRAPASGAADAEPVFATEADPTPGQVLYLRRSFLDEDLEHPERFRRGRDDRAAIQSGFRARKLPFSERQSWLGSVLFRASAVRPRLVSQGGHVFILDPPRLTMQPQGDHRVRLPLGNVSRASAPLTGHVFTWEYERGRMVFRMHAVPGEDGVNVVLTLPADSLGTVRLNGHSLPGSGAQRLVQPGDWIVVEGRWGKEVFYLEQNSSGIVSEIDQAQQGARRTMSPRGAIDSLATPLVNALNTFVWKQHVGLDANRNQRHPAFSVEEHRAWLLDLQRRPLRLSIEESLQVSAQDALYRYVHPERCADGKRSPSKPCGRGPDAYWSITLDGRRYPRLPPRAAVSVLDVATGEVLAAATYPTERAIDDHVESIRRTRRSLVPAGLMRAAVIETERRRDRLKANHALVAHQIGSVVKPLFASALAMTWREGAREPDPLEHTATCRGTTPGHRHGRVINVLGVRMGRYVETPPAHGRGVTFERFLSESCNAYMFELGALALKRERTYTKQTCPNRLNDVLEQSTDGALAQYGEMYGAVLKDPETRGYHRYERSFWSPLSEKLEERTGDNGFGCTSRYSETLSAVSPAKVNLKVRSMAKCVPDYESFLKGGGTNRWSNVQLGVAYARLASGRRVEGRFLYQEPPDPTDDPRNVTYIPTARSESIGYRSPARFRKVREHVLAGMSGIFDPPRGTARSLRYVLKGSKKRPGILDLLATIDPDGRAWGAYGKTGSSVRDVGYQTTLNGAPELEELPVANFVLVLLRCESASLDEKRLACERLPPLGEPIRGYVVNVWVDGVPKVSGGSRAARLLRSGPGREFLRRLVEFEGSRR